VRIDKKVRTDIVIAAFNLTPKSDPKNPAVTSVLMNNGSYAIIKLLAVERPKFTDAAAAEKKMLKLNLTNFNGRLDSIFF